MAKAKAKSEPSTHNYFTSAAPKIAGAKKASNKEQKQTKGLLLYASIDAIEKSLKSLKANAGDVIKDHAFDEFVKVGLALQKRPDNYRGVEGPASASVELRKRSSRSPLDEMQVAALEELGIETETITEYSLNPECMTPAIMALLNKALTSVPGIPPNIFLSETKTVPTDNSLDQAFRLEADVAKEVLEVIGCLALKPRIEGEEFSETVARVAELLGAEIDRKTATAH